MVHGSTGHVGAGDAGATARKGRAPSSSDIPPEPGLSNAQMAAAQHDVRAATTSQETATEVEDPRLGPTLGRELPVGVYISVVGAYAWLLVAAWFFFGKSGRPDLELAFLSVVLLMLFALPAIAFRVAWTHSDDSACPWRDFLSSTVDTAIGPLSAGEAWLQILVIPGSLALAATLIGIVHSLVR
jgi:hypothetical protein